MLKEQTLQLSRLIARKVTLVPIMLTCAVLVAAFFGGIASGVATSFSVLAPNILGASAAISSEIFGLRNHPYDAYKSVRDTLQNNGLDSTPQGFKPQNFRNFALITAAFKRAESVDVCGSPLVSVPFNDQGAVEFTHVAFRLFGIDVTSLYYLYFVILGVSVVGYLVAFWGDYIACTALFGASCALYVLLRGYLFHEDLLLSVANPRFLSTIGIIPLLHMAFLMIRGEAPLRWQLIATILVQAAILSFAYAARSSSSWMVLALLLLFAIYLVQALAPALRGRRPAFISSVVQRRGAVLAVALAALVVIGTGRSLFLMPRSNSDLYAHTVWHNVFMGFYFSPEWKQRFGALYDNAESDQLSYNAAKHYIRQHHLPYPIAPNIFQRDRRTGDFSPLGSWAAYDELMRSVVFEFIREHPFFALKSFLIYRPLTFVRAMSIFVDTAISSVPIAAFVIFCVMCVCIALATPVSPSRQSNRLQFSELCGTLALCAVASLDSVFVVYSTDFLVSDQAFLLVMMIAVLSVGGLAGVFALMRARAVTPVLARN